MVFKKSSAPTKRTIAVKQRRTGMKKRTSTTVNAPFQSALLSFARTLISFLPGNSVIQTIADFGFKALGVTDAVSSVNENGQIKNVADVQVIGTCAMFDIDTSDVLAFTNRITPDFQKKEFFTPITAVKMRFINFKVINTTPSSTKQGQWAAAFIPYKNSLSSGIWNGHNKIFTFQKICQLPGARIGNASQPLFLRYAFKNPNDYGTRVQTLSSAFGRIVIGFEDYQRKSYKALDASEFQCSVEITGSMKAWQGLPLGEKLKAGYKIVDKLATPDQMLVLNKQTNEWFHFLDPEYHHHDNGVIVRSSKIIKDEPGVTEVFKEGEVVTMD